MFVYKKTIFEIHNDYRKSASSNSTEQEVFQILDIYCQILKTVVGHFVNQNDLLLIRSNKTYINELKKIEQNGELINNHKANSNQLQKIKLVIDCFTDVNENYHETIQQFIIKFFKSKNTLQIHEDIYKEKIAKFILANNIISNLDTFMNYIVPN